MKQRVVVAVTGASGSIYGFRLLEQLRTIKRVETHLILSRAAEKTGYLELGKLAADWKATADYCYALEDIGCRLASGSFVTNAMVVAPCSIHTLSAISTGISSNLIVRAADVTLKERRRLILMVRETPFHLGHLRSMVAVTEMGAIVAPPIPGFYHKPGSVLELVDQSIHRVLDLLGLPSLDTKRWDDLADSETESTEW